MQVLGVDIGGSGIKGAIVDTERGEFLTERLRIDTPQPAKPVPVAKVVGEIARPFLGGKVQSVVLSPAVVRHGVNAHSGQMSIMNGLALMRKRYCRSKQATGLLC